MLTRFPKLKILFIDPEEQVCTDMPGLLHELGEVVTATTATTAEEMFLKHHPHIIVTVLYDPLINPLALLEKFRAQIDPLYAYYVIGLIPANEPLPVTPKAIDPDLMAVLIKPVLIGQLKAKVWELGKDILQYALDNPQAY